MYLSHFLLSNPHIAGQYMICLVNKQGAVKKSADVIWDLHICFTQNVSPESSPLLTHLKHRKTLDKAKVPVEDLTGTYALPSVFQCFMCQLIFEQPLLLGLRWNYEKYVYLHV